jgi:hypothetical protein
MLHLFLVNHEEEVVVCGLGTMVWDRKRFGFVTLALTTRVFFTLEVFNMLCRRWSQVYS